MLYFNNTTITVECKGYICEGFMFNEDNKQAALMFKNTSKTEDIKCPYCGGKVYVHDMYTPSLKDIPLIPETTLTIDFIDKRYKCCDCQKTFSNEIPYRHKGTRITERAAKWICSMLKHKVSISAIQRLSGIHWDTIHNLQKEYMQEKIAERDLELKVKGYRPRYLAVDEFAIHKGHRYATTVMDLETGDVLWVGEGRTLEAFECFFKTVDPSLLETVIAVAMDMNASYYRLVEEHMPKAKIVYDRYHMQAQYGKEVLGVVRLTEARKHKEASQKLMETITDDCTKDEKNDIKADAKKELAAYSTLKKSRWPLLMNSNNLCDSKSQALNEILENHHDLAVCYAMKEDMCELFKLNDPVIAEKRWKAWFEAAKSSGIPALVSFAMLKEKRLPGLIAHAQYPISTGKLEGFNNKIKVAKRIAYGYRDDDFFFMLVRFLALPSSK